jgi:hypothetical protein
LLHNGRLAAVIISISGKLAVSFGAVIPHLILLFSVLDGDRPF